MAVTTLPEANIAIAQQYLSMREALPETRRDALDEIIGNPVLAGKTSGFLELAYACREHLTDEHKAAAAAVGQFATAHGFYGLGVDNRGLRMVAVLQGTAPDDDTAPQPAAQYVETMVQIHPWAWPSPDVG